MKKTIAMLLVAMLTVGSVFAAVSGSANIEFGVNLNDKAYGILDQGATVGMAFELASDSGENVGEGDIYASIKGSLVLEVVSVDGGIEKDEVKDAFKNGTDYALGINVAIDEAKIYGSNWYVSILSKPSVPDFAKSEIDTWKKDSTTYGVVTGESTNKASVKAAYVSGGKAGVEVGIADYVIGAALNGTYGDNHTLVANGFVKTPEFDFDGLTLQVAAIGGIGDNPGVMNAGASAKVGYASDEFSISAAADVAISKPANGDLAFNFDAAANAEWNGIEFDLYYGHENVEFKDDHIDNLLSAQAAFDLNGFDLPLSITAGVKDAINTTDIFGEVSTSIDAVSLTLSGEFAVQVEKDWEVALEASYALDLGTITGTVGYAGNNTLTTEVVFETETLVPGATLTLGWTKANLLDGKLGTIAAGCTMEF